MLQKNRNASHRATARADEEPSPALIPVGKPIKHPAEVAPALEHNEFIVYDAARVKLRYVLQVRFDGGCGAFLQGKGTRGWSGEAGVWLGLRLG